MALTQTQLAARLRVSLDTVSRWETGQNQPKADQLKQLCQTLCVSADWLIFGQVHLIDRALAKRLHTQESLGDDFYNALPMVSVLLSSDVGLIEPEKLDATLRLIEDRRRTLEGLRLRETGEPGIERAEEEPSGG